jgi:DNA-nicking Smr family endonuclease
MDSGAFQIDAILDLHGMSLAIAYKTFLNFINDRYAKNNRMLLVITGKGTKSIEGEAKIKKELPIWINKQDVSNKVIRFSRAISKHGGDGAFYILLKRRKDL